MNPGEHENPEPQIPPSDGTPPPPDGTPPPRVDPPAKIQWGLFFRLASPLAIVSGVVSSLLLPIIVVLILPISLKRIIARYKPFHSGMLQSGQGAALGAFTALLSFVAYLAIIVPLIAANRTHLADIFPHRGANADPQLAQLLATTEGLISFVASLLIVSLALFLITGAISGALLIRRKKVP